VAGSDKALAYNVTIVINAKKVLHKRPEHLKFGKRLNQEI
jgi:hypothetical protein